MEIGGSASEIRGRFLSCVGNVWRVEAALCWCSSALFCYETKTRSVSSAFIPGDAFVTRVNAASYHIYVLLGAIPT